MKMYLGKTPIKSLNIKHYEMDTNSATMVPSDLQAGVTAFAKGKKVTGTGKSFEFAMYGGIQSNDPWYIPTTLNVIHINSTVYPTKSMVALNEMKNIDFSTEQTIATVTIDAVDYPVKAVVKNNIFTIICDKALTFEVFYGKDNYV